MKAPICEGCKEPYSVKVAREQGSSDPARFCCDTCEQAAARRAS